MTVFSTLATGGRKRRGEGHTRREEILQAAKELFLEYGYDSTTIRRIADRVGISAPALYLYFKDKEALMLALCDQTFGHLLEAISEIERTVEDPLERIRRFGEAYARFGLSHPDEYRLVFLGANIPESMRKVGHRAATDDPTRCPAQRPHAVHLRVAGGATVGEAHGVTPHAGELIDDGVAADEDELVAGSVQEVPREAAADASGSEDDRLHADLALTTGPARSSSRPPIILPAIASRAVA